MKKQWNNPLLSVYKTIDDTVTGEGSGQSTPDILPYSYEMWVVIFEDFPEIYNADGEGESGTWADYVKYMTDNDFYDFIDWNEEP